MASAYDDTMSAGSERIIPNIKGFLHPSSIALVGVPRGIKPGKVFFLGLLDQGFDRPLYLVHPQAEVIDGHRTYRSVLDIPGSVDLAIIMSPKESVPGILKECCAKKIGYAILYTSGFSETGDKQGMEEEEHILALARSGGIRILGPNCMGVYSPASRLAPFPFMPKKSGRLAFLSQSGSLMNLFVNMCAGRRLFLRYAVSYGNSSDVDFPELLAGMMDDPDVHVVCSYCEGMDPGRMRGVLAQSRGEKPLIMWKVGRTDAGSRAAASHTGSLGGKETLWKSLFRQYGVIEVFDIEEMFDTVQAFSSLTLQGQGRIAVLSGPGGPAVSAADAVETSGLEMASPGANTMQSLRELLPSTGTSVCNPIDVGLGASFDLRLYLETLEMLMEDPGIDCVIILGGGVSDEMNEQYVQGLIDRKRRSDKHIIAIAYPGFIQNEKILAPLYESGIPVYPTPERAVRAYARMMQYQRFIRSLT